MREVFYAMVLSGVCAVAALVGFARLPQRDEALCAAPEAHALGGSDEDVQMSVTVRRMPL